MSLEQITRQQLVVYEIRADPSCGGGTYIQYLEFDGSRYYYLGKMTTVALGQLEWIMSQLNTDLEYRHPRQKYIIGVDPNGTGNELHSLWLRTSRGVLFTQISSDVLNELSHIRDGINASVFVEGRSVETTTPSAFRRPEALKH